MDTQASGPIDSAAKPPARAGRGLSLVLAGIISLVVGIAVGVAVNYLTERKPNLEYDVVTSATFPGENEHVAIFALTVANRGNREIESVACRIDLERIALRDQRIKGLHPSAYSVGYEPGTLTVTVPFLNPGDDLSIQLLLSSSAATPPVPPVDVRGRGVTGVPRRPSAGMGVMPKVFSGLAISMSVLTAFSTILAVRERRSRMTQADRGIRHHGDQRDLLAYVLSIHGFREEAEEVRRSWTKRLYWSESHHLAERALQSEEDALIRRTLECLQYLVDYAGIHEESEALIHVDIARLALALGDEPTAAKHMGHAKGEKLVERRLQRHPELQALAAARENT